MRKSCSYRCTAYPERAWRGCFFNWLLLDKRVCSIFCTAKVMLWNCPVQMDQVAQSLLTTSPEAGRWLHLKHVWNTVTTFKHRDLPLAQGGGSFPQHNSSSPTSPACEPRNNRECMCSPQSAAFLGEGNRGGGVLFFCTCADTTCHPSSTLPNPSQPWASEYRCLKWQIVKHSPKFLCYWQQY